MSIDIEKERADFEATMGPQGHDPMPEWWYHLHAAAIALEEAGFTANAIDVRFIADGLAAQPAPIPAHPEITPIFLLNAALCIEDEHGVPQHKKDQIVEKLNRLADELQASKQAGNALTEEAKDAARFRQAIALEDNAEALYAFVLCHAPDAEAIRRIFDAHLKATPYIKAGQAGKEGS